MALNFSSACRRQHAREAIIAVVHVPRRLEDLLQGVAYFPLPSQSEVVEVAFLATRHDAEARPAHEICIRIVWEEFDLDALGGRSRSVTERGDVCVACLEGLDDLLEYQLYRVVKTTWHIGHLLGAERARHVCDCV